MFRDIGFEHFIWQVRTPDELFTWDAMPAGFLEHYYGTKLDQPCAVAEAIRQHWQSFTFHEARRRFKNRPRAQQAEDLFKAFGIQDGMVFFAGRSEENSALALCTSQNADDIIGNLQPVLAAAAWKIFLLLEGHSELVPLSRLMIEVSPSEMRVLQTHIDNPHLSLTEQAHMLGMAQYDIEQCHRAIADRLGVSCLVDTPGQERVGQLY